MSTETLYTETFFDARRTGAILSALEILPIVLDLLPVRSACDVGCGTGSWLKVLQEKNISDVIGVDGDYVDRLRLDIPAEKFVAADLTKPIRLGRRFDLAICLEVAEHLPEECAGMLIESLTQLAPAVLFSAAIPLQGGRGHINEQWPDYWAARYVDRNFQAIDAIRNKVWQNKKVRRWYAQNTILYCHEELIQEVPALRVAAQRTCSAMLSVVHPQQYLSGCARCDIEQNAHLSLVLRALPKLLVKSIRHRLA